MPARPPTSPLFPYTTLFRSHVVGAPLARCYLDQGAQAVLDGAQGGDRKSTRLNSSHGYISYAVFCLKKKKEGKPLTRCGPSGQPHWGNRRAAPPTRAPTGRM